jgi:hypothetical protein
LIQFPAFGQIALKVKTIEAEVLKRNWSKVEYTDIRFAPVKNMTTGRTKIMLSHITITNGANYKSYNWAVTDNVRHAKLPESIMGITGFESVINDKAVIDTSNISDVDIDITKTKNKMPFTYALIIGNEAYNEIPQDPDITVDASFAVNDALIFREYCVRTLGIPLGQTKLLLNANNSEILYGLEWLIEQTKYEKGEGNVIVYYSGLIITDTKAETPEPFLIPTDYDGSTLLTAVGLGMFYRRMNDYPTTRTTIFLDARHKTARVSTEELEAEAEAAAAAVAAAAAEAEAEAAKSAEENKSRRSRRSKKNKKTVIPPPVMAAPRSDVQEITLLPMGNTVVFTSKASGDNSGTYSKRQHGYFTYFLLKAIQQSKGNIVYADIQKEIYTNLYTDGGRYPVSVSESLEDWEAWQLNK